MYARTLAISCVLALCSAAALPERERVNSVSDASGSVNTAVYITRSADGSKLVMPVAVLAPLAVPTLAIASPATA